MTGRKAENGNNPRNRAVQGGRRAAKAPAETPPGSLRELWYNEPDPLMEEARRMATIPTSGRTPADIFVDRLDLSDFNSDIKSTRDPISAYNKEQVNRNFFRVFDPINEFTHHYTQNYFNNDAIGFVTDEYLHNHARLVDKFLNTSKNEEGYVEKATNDNLEDKTANAGENNWTKYGEWFGLNGNYIDQNGELHEAPWCAMYVDWCADDADMPVDLVPHAKNDENKKYYFASTGNYINWYKDHERYMTSKTGYIPRPGDLIFYEWYRKKMANMSLTNTVIKSLIAISVL
jgi:hypothetical protein